MIDENKIAMRIASSDGRSFTSAADAARKGESIKDRILYQICGYYEDK